MNKKGWLRVVEVFTTIFIIAGVLLILINRSVYGGRDIQKEIYESEIGILREIQLNNTMRGLVLAATVDSESGGEGFPEEITTLMMDRKPNYLNCKAKICSTEAASDLCRLSSYENKDTYAQSAIITVLKTSSGYIPRRLKIFCWIKS